MRAHAARRAPDLARQRARLESLGLGHDPQAPPAGLGADRWRSLLPPSQAAERIALGRDLFFEPRLSADGTVACASCHDVTRGFGDGRRTSVGIGGRVGRRNAPPVANAGLLATFFWDGRAATLEEQAEMPILNPSEMGQPSRAAALAAVARLPRYRTAFRRAFGRAPRFEDLASAIASFERTLVFVDSPVTRFLDGDAAALTEEERKGRSLFVGKALCATCHHLTPQRRLATDGLFHNVGVSSLDPDFETLARRESRNLRIVSLLQVDGLAIGTELSLLGRFVLSRDPVDLGAFRTPSLLNVGVTAPYMHNGEMETLWDVVDFYNRGAVPGPHLDESIQPLRLTGQEVDQLVAFLFAFTDRRFVEDNRRERQRQEALARTRRPFQADPEAAGGRAASGAASPARGGSADSPR